MASQSESNQVPVNQEQESESLQQKIQEDTQEKVGDVQPDTENQNKTDNADNTNKVQDESSALDKSDEKVAKKKTKKKAKKEEEVVNDAPAEAKEGEVKESQPEAEKTENKEEPAEKKPKKKKKTAEKIEVPTAEGEAPQQEEKAAKPKKKATKKDNAETTLVANIVAESKQENEGAAKEEPVKEQTEAVAKQSTEGASKVANKGKANDTTPVKTKAKAEAVKVKEEASNKQPEVIKTSAKPSIAKEDTKSPVKVEKLNAVAEQPNKTNAKANAESERVNWKAKVDVKATPDSATKKPVNLKEQVVASPSKNETVAKNNEKRPEAATPGKAKQTPQKPQKENEAANKKATNEVDTTTNNILEGLTPSKEAKTPENPKSAKKVTVNETIREQRSISPRKQIKGSEKQRVRSFDAGKTQKVDPNDSFETRAKVWEIRKKEKLLEEEKKSSRKEIEECTFTPIINKKAAVKATLNGDFLQRNAEWSEKVKASINYKTEKYLEETMKSDIKKSKLQPGVDSVYGDLRTLRLHEVHRAPNSGNLRAANFELLNQDPAGVQERLNEKLAEIHDIYDNISSALKAKSARNRDDLQKATRPITMDSSRKGQPIAYPAKTLVAKVILTASTEEVNRLESLKSILISNKKKEQPNKSVTNNASSSQVYLTEADNAQEILKKATKHLEIRNNRYVMIDNNISAIEKGEGESNDISLNLETA